MLYIWHDSGKACTWKTINNIGAATISGGISGKELMYRAGKAIYESVEWKAPVGIVCGVGNNAGDGYVLADLLAKAGTECTFILLEDRFSEDGRYYYDRCLKQNILSNFHLEKREKY